MEKAEPPTSNKPLVGAKTAAATGFAQHIRTQFESLQRKPELAADLDCFRTEGELASISYIAHPHGLHVARWLKVLAHTGTTVEVETANPVPAYAGEYAACHPVLPAWLRIPMTLRYLLCGLALRFSRFRSAPGCCCGW